MVLFRRQEDWDKLIRILSYMKGTSDISFACTIAYSSNPILLNLGLLVIPVGNRVGSGHVRVEMSKIRVSILLEWNHGFST